MKVNVSTNALPPHDVISLAQFLLLVALPCQSTLAYLMSHGAFFFNLKCSKHPKVF